jgi:PAS domain S-box-containing protein
VLDRWAPGRFPAPLAVYLLLAVAITGSGALYLRRSQQELQAQVEGELSSIAAAKVSQLAGWRTGRVRAWSGFRTNSFVADAVRRALGAGDDDPAHLHEVLASLESKREREQAVEALLVGDDARVVLATAGAAAPTARDQALVRAALERGEPAVDDGARAGEPFTVAIPLVGPPGQRGAVLARYDLSASLDPIVRDWPHRARTAEPVLVRRDGDFVAAVTSPLHTPLRQLPLSLDMPTSRALKGVRGIVHCDDYRGVPVIAALAAVPDTPWHLSVKVDRDEVLAEGRERALAFGATTLLLLALGGAAVWSWWGAQVRATRQRDASAEAARYQATLLENIHDGVLGLDLQGRITAWAGAAERIYGYSAAEAIGRRISELLPSDRTPEEIRAAVTREIAGAGRCRLELRVTRKDGQPVDVEFTAVPLRDRAGATSGFVAVHRDVSDRRRAERERQELQAELAFADRLASIGTLAAGVAHEINNPLSYLLANLDFVQQQLRGGGERPADRSAQLAAAEEAADGARRIAEIVRGLRVFSRRDRAESSGRVDVAAAVQAAVRMAQGQARPRARLVVDLADDTPHIPGREHEVAQVALNLIVNAIQAIPEGRPDRNEVRVSTRAAPGGGAVLTVSDTGDGIAPDHLRRVFDPFFTTKPHGEGSGLGLPICRGIVERMGGSILLESAPGRGTTFTVELPGGASPAQPEDGPAAAGVRRGRVLVVDDEPLVCRSIRRALARDHEVVELHDGRAAIERVAAGEHFDVVLCDVVMPGMSGLECFAELSRLRPEIAPRVMFLTGGAFTPGSQEFLAGNAGRVIEKPFEPDALRARVADAMRRAA